MKKSHRSAARISLSIVPNVIEYKVLFHSTKMVKKGQILPFFSMLFQKDMLQYLEGLWDRFHFDYSIADVRRE